MACKILVVEDEDLIRESLVELLELEGFEAVPAANGKIAFDYLMSHPDEPCMILLDLMMPVMSGWEFLQRYRETKSVAPVFVVSANADPRSLQATGYMPKPIDFDVLLSKVRHYC